jgi:hypothetical protein
MKVFPPGNPVKKVGRVEGGAGYNAFTNSVDEV